MENYNCVRTLTAKPCHQDSTTFTKNLLTSIAAAGRNDPSTAARAVEFGRRFVQLSLTQQRSIIHGCLAEACLEQQSGAASVLAGSIQVASRNSPEGIGVVLRAREACLYISRGSHRHTDDAIVKQAAKEVAALLRDDVASLYSRRMLVVRAIRWDTASGRVLEKVASAETVHPTDRLWRFRSRFGHDRTCYGLFHRAAEQGSNDPVAFIHVAMTAFMAGNMAELAKQSNTSTFLRLFGGGCDWRQHALDRRRSAYLDYRVLASTSSSSSSLKSSSCEPVHTTGNDPGRYAMCWSVGNAEPGLAGVGVGRSLIHGLLEQCRGDPGVAGVVTLSPVPGFAKWLQTTSKHAISRLQESPAVHGHGHTQKQQQHYALDRSDLSREQAASAAASHPAALQEAAQLLKSVSLPLTEADITAFLQQAPRTQESRPPDRRSESTKAQGPALGPAIASSVLRLLMASFRTWQHLGATHGREMDRRADESIVRASHRTGSLAGLSGGADNLELQTGNTDFNDKQNTQQGYGGDTQSSPRRPSTTLSALPAWAVGPSLAPRRTSPATKGSGTMRRVDSRDPMTDSTGEYSGLSRGTWPLPAQEEAALGRVCMRLVSHYLVRAGWCSADPGEGVGAAHEDPSSTSRLGATDARRPLCPVSNFHTGNGAELVRVLWGANLSPKGMVESGGIMANYEYPLLPECLEGNQLRYARCRGQLSEDGALRLASMATGPGWLARPEIKAAAAGHRVAQELPINQWGASGVISVSAHELGMASVSDCSSDDTVDVFPWCAPAAWLSGIDPDPHNTPGRS